jgi:hypothetical protein
MGNFDVGQLMVVLVVAKRFFGFGIQVKWVINNGSLGYVSDINLRVIN